MPFAVAKGRARALNQQLAQIAVAHLGDPPEPRLAAGRSLARGQSEKSGELPPAGKLAEVLDRGEKRRGGDRADPGNGHEPPRGLVGLGGGLKLPVDRLDCFVERVDLPDKREEGEAHAVGNHDMRGETILGGRRPS